MSKIMQKDNNKTTKMDRRSFLYGQIALASTVGFCGTASAFEIKQDSKIANLTQASWKTGTADEFSEFIGQPFTGFAKDGTMLHLTLIDAVASKSGSARPRHLARSEGVSLVFKSDFTEHLAEQGHQTVSMWHSTLGEFQLFLGAIPRKSGGYDVEAILN